MAVPVVLIGLDGGDPDLVFRWIEEGHLPTLKYLFERGTGGVLLSTPNAISPEAWSSFATGLRPGRHGVFSFLDRIPGTYRLIYSGSRLREGVTFWRAASHHGKRVAVLFEPTTYPAEAINGVHICGWMAPEALEEGLMYPAELQEEIARRFPHYQRHETGLRQYVEAGRYEEAIEWKLRSVQGKGDVACFIAEQGPWDCFVCAFIETDSMQHYFWDYMTGEREAAEPVRQAILRTYQAADAQMARLLERLPSDACVIVFSDHGARKNNRGHLYLKGLLQAMGLEVSRPGGEERLNRFRQWQRRLYALVPAGLRARLKPHLKGLVSRLATAQYASDIDFGRSRAYSFYSSGMAQIWLNIAGRDPQGLVQPGAEQEQLIQEITEVLLQATEAETGAPLVQAVHRKEELYEGPYIHRAPDLLVDWTEAVVRAGIRSRYQGREFVVTEYCRDESSLRFAIHRREGLLIVSGGGAQGQPQGAAIEDVPVNALALMEVPPPGELDGRVWQEVFPELQRQAAVAMPPQGAEEMPTYTAEEEAQIEERLRDLGYL